MRAAVLSISLLALGGCGGAAEPSREGAAAQADADWAALPRPTDVSRGPGGGLVLQGRTEPDARVRVTVYGGEAYGAQADRTGAFSVALPAADGAGLLAVSGVTNDREVEADGWMFVPADRPERAVVLRPGSPSLPVRGGGPLDLVAVDYDAAGGAAVSGVAPPGASVTVLLDGRPAARGAADAVGRFALRLDARAAAGSRAVLLSSGDARLARTIALVPPPPAGSLSIVRQADGWRVQWPTSGGGAQSTLILTGGDA